MWWSNTDQRRQQKEVVKAVIRRTKLTEKSDKMGAIAAQGGPPGLSHSVPTSDTYSDLFDRTRAASVESQNSLHFDPVECIHPTMMHYPTYAAALPPPNLFSPYDVDVKTERQTFVNDVPTRRDSSMSTFSTFHPPALAALATPVAGRSDSWILPDEDWDQAPLVAAEWVTAEPVTTAAATTTADLGYFDLLPPAPAPVTTHHALVPVDELDRPLLDHFLNHVLPLIVPLYDLHQPGSARDAVIMPALESNRGYRHCCLSVAALHQKATRPPSGADEDGVDGEVLRHRFATVAELCDALGRDTDHAAILEATLAMIVFPAAVGRPEDDGLPDIAWHQHFEAVTNLIQKLELATITGGMPDLHGAPPHASFDMALTAWVDILGATMLGRAPRLAHTYREKYENGWSSGLGELMGCDDRVMYLISEMACLDGLKRDGMDDIRLCEHVQSLAMSVGATEPGPGAVRQPYSATGALRPRQLARNLTAVFRFAARIYLCSLVPGYDPNQASIVDLVHNLTDALEYVPSGPDGFDRALVWPYLIAGAAAATGGPASSYRTTFARRLDAMGPDLAGTGSFGRMVRLVHEVWHQTDLQVGSVVHWRDVMQQRGWDDLLI